MFEGELAISKGELTSLQIEAERLQKALDLERLRKTWCLKHCARVDGESLVWGRVSIYAHNRHIKIIDGDVDAAINRAMEGSE